MVSAFLTTMAFGPVTPRLQPLCVWSTATVNVSPWHLKLPTLWRPCPTAPSGWSLMKKSRMRSRRRRKAKLVDWIKTLNWICALFATPGFQNFHLDSVFPCVSSFLVLSWFFFHSFSISCCGGAICFFPAQDCTGSMGSYIRAAQDNIQSIVSKIGHHGAKKTCVSASSATEIIHHKRRPMSPSAIPLRRRSRP